MPDTDNPTPTPIADLAQTNPTPASQWRKQQQDGFIVTLPSGNTARITRSDFFLTLLKENHLPNPLANIVGDMIKNQGDTVPDINAVVDELGAEVVPVLITFMDEVTMKVMLEPRVEERPTPRKMDTSEEQAAEDLRCRSWEPSEGAIALENVEVEDRAFLFRVAMGGTTDLESFRAEQAQNVGAVQHGGKVPLPAKRTPRPTKPKKRAAKQR